MNIEDDKIPPLKWLWNSYVREHFIFLFIALIFMSIEGSMLGLLSYSIKFLFDNVLVSRDTSSILFVAILIFSIFSIRAIAGFIHRLMTVNVCQKIIKALQDRMVEHLINMDVVFHQKNSPGTLMDRVRADSKALSESIGEAFMTVGRDGFSLISLVAVVFFIDWKWSLIAFLGIPFLVLPILLLQGLVRFRAGENRDFESKANVRLDEIFHGITDIKLNRAEKSERNKFFDILKEAKMHIEEWSTTDRQQAESLGLIKKEIEDTYLFCEFLMKQNGWRHLSEWSQENLGVETQELINSILIELYPELVDNLELETGADEKMFLIPNMALDELEDIIESKYYWAMAFDNKEKANTARFWYASENKEEPRFGWRYLEPGADKELRIGIAQEVQNLKTALAMRKPTTSKLNVAEFLISRPEFREIIQRIQNLQSHPYAEIRDNLLADICRPINLLRCKLAMFGATKFDPKSDLWIRITLFQGAPLKEQLSHENLDNWLFPSLKNGF